MKKFVLVFALLILSIGLFGGCKNEPSISCDLEEIKVYQNQEYTLSSSHVEIENYDEGYTISIKDEKIAKVVNKIIIPVSVGKTKLVISLDGYSEVYCEVDYEVMEGYIAEWITLDKSTVKINKELEPKGNNKVYFNSNCTEIPNVTYDDSLIDYNYKTGVITAKKTGKTIVTIEFMECKISFEVIVTDVVYTEVMTVKDAQIYKSTIGTLPFSIFPSSANTYRFWTASNILTIDNDGNYQTFESGTATVYYQYYTAYNQLSSVYQCTITVVDASIEYSIDVMNENLEGTANFMLDKIYKLVINCASAVNSSLFTISSNVELKSNFAWVENFGYVASFQFKESGDNRIDVYYTPVKDDLSLQLVRSKSVKVYSENDIRLVAFWSAYIQEKYEGKYRIFINNTSFIVDYLDFKLYLGDSLYDVTFDLYLLNNDNSLTLIDKSFMPTEVGEYTLVAKMGSEIIDTVQVLALYE